MAYKINELLQYQYQTNIGLKRIILVVQNFFVKCCQFFFYLINDRGKINGKLQTQYQII